MQRDPGIDFPEAAPQTLGDRNRATETFQHQVNARPLFMERPQASLELRALLAEGIEVSASGRPDAHVLAERFLCCFGDLRQTARLGGFA